MIDLFIDRSVYQLIDWLIDWFIHLLILCSFSVYLEHIILFSNKKRDMYIRITQKSRYKCLCTNYSALVARQEMGAITGTYPYRCNPKFELSIYQNQFYKIVLCANHINNICTGTNLAFLATYRTVSHECQIVHWSPLGAKQSCPK